MLAAEQTREWTERSPAVKEAEQMSSSQESVEQTASDLPQCLSELTRGVVRPEQEEPVEVAFHLPLGLP